MAREGVQHRSPHHPLSELIGDLDVAPCRREFILRINIKAVGIRDEDAINPAHAPTFVPDPDGTSGFVGRFIGLQDRRTEFIGTREQVVHLSEFHVPDFDVAALDLDAP